MFETNVNYLIKLSKYGSIYSQMEGEAELR